MLSLCRVTILFMLRGDGAANVAEPLGGSERILDYTSDFRC